VRPGRVADHSPPTSAAVMGHTRPVKGSYFLLDEMRGQRHAPAALRSGKRPSTLCIGG
jgi:hypothetical protein